MVVHFANKTFGGQGSERYLSGFVNNRSLFFHKTFGRQRSERYQRDL